MRSNSAIDFKPLERMLNSDKRAQYSTYRMEIETPLSLICEAGDALGPLILSKQISQKQWLLTGNVSYSRFRPGDRVEIRIQKANTDTSEKFSYDWIVASVSFPNLGKIEVILKGEKQLEINGIKEVFLFKSLTTRFNNLLIKNLNEITTLKRSIILGLDHFDLSIQDSNYKELYENLNETQKRALEYLIDYNLNGAIQGPPGTGKTQLLQAVVTLALKSNMKVCVASFTNAAVDNLLGRIVSDNFEYEWCRVGNSEKLKREFYPKISASSILAVPGFNKEVKEANLFGSTLHKLAFNRTAPEVDLLVIDEAGQVPIYFWPFIQRLAKRVVMVGDQFQLPPVFATKHTELPFDNIFSLNIDEETPMLETQYRMRREIQAWSSEKFYKGKLVPHSSVADRDYFLGRFALFTDKCMEYRKFSSLNNGKSSQSEANFIADRIEKIINDDIDLKNIGVICPYRAQAGLVNSVLQNKFGVNAASRVLVDTVERFQGQEKEAIFLSLGSSGKNKDELRFLSDPKRLNVSVTRAKSRFYCLFDNNLWDRSNDGQSNDLNEFLRWVTFGKTSIKRAA